MVAFVNNDVNGLYLRREPILYLCWLVGFWMNDLLTKKRKGKEVKRKMFSFLHLCPNEMKKVTKIHGHKSNFQSLEKSIFATDTKCSVSPTQSESLFSSLSSILSSKQWKRLTFSSLLSSSSQSKQCKRTKKNSQSKPRNPRKAKYTTNQWNQNERQAR